MTQLSKESLKYPQIDAAFRYIYDHRKKYHYRNREFIPLTDIYEFGVYNGNSLLKICNYVKSNDFVGIPIHIHGYDSFDGLPKEQDGVPVFSKFSQGAYKCCVTPDIIMRSCDYKYLSIDRVWFDQLNKDDHAFKAALLIHIDCDLYISTKQALKFMYNNRLVWPGTLIAFDEYESVTGGGEKKAFEEILKEYPHNAEEIWHFTYMDKQTNTPIRQSLWEVFI